MVPDRWGFGHMEKLTTLAVASSVGIATIWRAKTQNILKTKLGMAMLAAVAVNVVVLSVLVTIFDFQFVYVKISEFVVHQLSRITTQGAFLTTVAVCLIVEMFLVKEGKSSLQRLIKPSNRPRPISGCMFFW